MDLRYWKNGFEPAWLLMKYLTNNRFAEQSYRVSSLFSLLSSLEKVEVKNREKREKRIVKSEENKKKKPLMRLFLFGTLKGIFSQRCRAYRLASLVAAAKKQSAGLFFHALFESLLFLAKQKISATPLVLRLFLAR